MSHHERTAPTPRHEADVTSVKPFVYIMLATLLLVPLFSLGLWFGFKALQESQPKLLFKEVKVAPDQVHLQANPARDLEVLNREMSERLHNTGWVRRESGVVHMPIDRAMTLLVERGLKDESQ